jgi:hypothetical protein
MSSDQTGLPLIALSDQSDLSTQDEFFSLTSKEAETFPKQNFTKMASVSVYHGLHCVNAIRMHIDRAYYIEHGGLYHEDPGLPPSFNRVHMCKLKS